MTKKPKGEVHEIITALEHLSAQSGTRPDVVQNKRDCFQVRGSGPAGDQKSTGSACSAAGTAQAACT